MKRNASFVNIDLIILIKLLVDLLCKNTEYEVNANQMLKLVESWSGIFEFKLVVLQRRDSIF